MSNNFRKILALLHKIIIPNEHFMNKGLLVSAVIILFGCALTSSKEPVCPISQSPFPERISDYDIQHYQIRVTLTDKEKKVIGNVKITLKPKVDNFKRVELDAADMIFSEISVNNTKLK